MDNKEKKARIVVGIVYWSAYVFLMSLANHHYTYYCNMSCSEIFAMNVPIFLSFSLGWYAIDKIMRNRNNMS